MTDDESFESAIDDVMGRVWPSAGTLCATADLLQQIESLRLVYADWLEDHGDPRAFSQRWMAQHGKFPRFAGPTWDWWQHGDRPDCNPEDLPRRIWDALSQQPRKDMPYCKEYPSRRKAERELHKALATLERT